MTKELANTALSQTISPMQISEPLVKKEEIYAPKKIRQ